MSVARSWREPSIGGSAGWAVICEKVRILSFPLPPYDGGAPWEGVI